MRAGLMTNVPKLASLESGTMLFSEELSLHQTSLHADHFPALSPETQAHQTSRPASPTSTPMTGRTISTPIQSMVVQLAPDTGPRTQEANEECEVLEPGPLPDTVMETWSGQLAQHILRGEGLNPVLTHPHPSMGTWFEPIAQRAVMCVTKYFARRSVKTTALAPLQGQHRNTEYRLNRWLAQHPYLRNGPTLLQQLQAVWPEPQAISAAPATITEPGSVTISADAVKLMQQLFTTLGQPIPPSLAPGSMAPAPALQSAARAPPPQAVTSTATGALQQQSGRRRRRRRTADPVWVYPPSEASRPRPTLPQHAASSYSNLQPQRAGQYYSPPQSAASSYPPLPPLAGYSQAPQSTAGLLASLQVSPPLAGPSTPPGLQPTAPSHAAEPPPLITITKAPALTIESSAPAGHRTGAASDAVRQNSPPILILGDSNFTRTPFSSYPFLTVGISGLGFASAARRLRELGLRPHSVKLVILGLGINDSKPRPLAVLARQMTGLKAQFRELLPGVPILHLPAPALKLRARQREQVEKVNRKAREVFRTIREPRLAEIDTGDPRYNPMERREVARTIIRAAKETCPELGDLSEHF